MTENKNDPLVGIIQRLGHQFPISLLMTQSLMAHDSGRYQDAIICLESAIEYINDTESKNISTSRDGTKITINQEEAQARLRENFLQLGKEGLSKPHETKEYLGGKLAVDSALIIDPNCQEAIDLKRSYQEASQNDKG